jgi:hypothetical protein
MTIKHLPLYAGSLSAIVFALAAPSATFAFKHVDGTLEVTMTDGKPSGWTASGHGIVTLATGSWASLNGEKYEWSGKGTGPNVFEGDYTFK